MRTRFWHREGGRWASPLSRHLFRPRRRRSLIAAAHGRLRVHVDDDGGVGGGGGGNSGGGNGGGDERFLCVFDYCILRVSRGARYSSRPRASKAVDTRNLIIKTRPRCELDKPF